MVASNVSAYRFIAGPTVPFDRTVGGTIVTLARDGQEVNRGVGHDALGDPVEAYRWMVRKAANVGYAPLPGMVMLTGALGRVVDNADASPALTQIDIDNPKIAVVAERRNLRIILPTGGAIRLCDPKVAAGDPRTC